MALLDDVYVLPFDTHYLFTKLVDIACPPLVKNSNRTFLVGFRNVALTNVHNFSEYVYF